MTHNAKRSRLQSEIDDNLRKAFDEVVKQDVPDRFLNLLDHLRAQETAQSGETQTRSPVPQPAHGDDDHA